MLPDVSMEKTITNYDDSAKKNVQSESKMIMEDSKPLAPPVPHGDETDLDIEIPAQKNTRNKTFDLGMHQSSTIRPF